MTWCEANGVSDNFGLGGNATLYGMVSELTEDVAVRRAGKGDDARVRRYADLRYAAGSWSKHRRVDDVLEDDANLRPAPRLARGISSPSGHGCGNFSQCDYGCLYWFFRIQLPSSKLRLRPISESSARKDGTQYRFPIIAWHRAGVGCESAGSLRIVGNGASHCFPVSWRNGWQDP